MKSLIITAFLFTAFQAFAADWSELEIGKSYKLNQTIEFPEGAEFKAGEEFQTEDFFPVNGSVMYVDMSAVNCAKPEVTGEMILVNPNPEDTSVDRSVGLTLDENCHLGVFIEVRDIYSKSLFE